MAIILWNAFPLSLPVISFPLICPSPPTLSLPSFFLPQVFLGLPAWVGASLAGFRSLNSEGNLKCTVCHCTWVFPNRLLANTHPLAPNNHSCGTTIGPALIPSCLSPYLCQRCSPRLSLIFWTLIATWPCTSFFSPHVSPLPNFWNPSTVTSQHSLFTLLFWIFSSTSCYSEDLFLPRTRVLLQIMTIFSPSLLIP